MNRHRSARYLQLICALWLALATSLSACQPAGSSVVHIYVSFPLRGPKIGGSIVKGIQLAFDEIESRVGNTEIVLQVLDDGDENGQWQAEQEITNTLKAVGDPLTVAYLGPMNSGAAELSIPLTNRAGIVQISPSTTWPGLTKVGFAQGEPGLFYPTGKRTFYRTCATDDVQGPAAALWAHDLNFQTFYVLDDGEAYGAGVAALFARRAEQIGLTNVGHQTIDKTARDFTSVLAQVKAAKPELVYFGGTVANGAALILEQMRAMGIQAAYMGPDAVFDTTLIDMAGQAAEGVYVTFVGVPPNQLRGDVGQKFYAAYKQKFNEEPEPFAEYGYDAAQVLIEAMRQAPRVDRASLLAVIARMNEFKGTVGTFSFDNNGDTTVTLVSGSVVQDGVFKFAKVLDAQQ